MKTLHYPSVLAIPTVRHAVNATVRPPGSKSLSNRALPIAAMARGVSELSGLLASDDTEVMIGALRQLGVSVVESGASSVRLDGVDGVVPSQSADLSMGNSGTSIRFLAALMATQSGRYRFDGVPRMRERPAHDLLCVLRQWGAIVTEEEKLGFPPFVIEGRKLGSADLTVSGSTSSQFLSGLLMAAPLASGPVTVRVIDDLVSEPYVPMTLAVMRAFGASVAEDHAHGQRVYRVNPTGYTGTQYAIEPDASGASYFFGLAAVLGGQVTVPELGTSSLQGDLRFVQLIRQMGAEVHQDYHSTTVISKTLQGITADLADISDTVPTLAAVACFASSPTRIYGVEHIRHKECDRIAAVVTELRRAGFAVSEQRDGLTIDPAASQPRSASFATYQDHRLAMAMALVALRVPGCEIQDPGCVAKTYPQFFHDLQAATQTSA